MSSQLTFNRHIVKFIEAMPQCVHDAFVLAAWNYLNTEEKTTAPDGYEEMMDILYSMLKKSRTSRENGVAGSAKQTGVSKAEYNAKRNAITNATSNAITNATSNANGTLLLSNTQQLTQCSQTKEQETNKKETTPLKDNINTPIKKEIKKKEKMYVDVQPTQEELNFQDMMKQYPRVAKMDSPLTLTKWNNAVKKMLGYTETEEQAKAELMLVLEEMDNYKLLKNYVDASRVLNKWCHYETRTPIKRIDLSKQPTLGVDEYISKKDGKRYYGEGRVAVPFSAPPRPSTGYSWIHETSRWEKSF